MAKIAWLFPGQGSQAVGMGKDLAGASAAARECFRVADEALGMPLSRLCFEGPLEELTLTENTQPAIVTTSAAVVAALRERHPTLPEPAFAAGHSLGEYSALTTAGALALGDAVRICRARGAAMQAAVPAGQGAMAAIMNLDKASIEAICAEVAASDGVADQGVADQWVVSAANFNAPTQTVIAGSAQAVARASALVTSRGGRAVPLKVSAPFHCALMAPARDGLAAALAAASLAAPRWPVLANVDAAPRLEAKAIASALLAQIDQPVQWVATIERMQAEGVTHALELGPGSVLAGLCKRIAKNLKVLSVGSVEALERVPAFFESESTHVRAE
jgi:[acyl-carrier-protein] S-malonyltransferase